MLDKENPISARSKRLITQSLLDLMDEVPFSKIAIRDVVERAGLTRQTFYHNFESKEDVLLYKLDELFDGFFQSIVDNKICDCEGIIWFYFRYWQNNRDFVKLLIKNNLVYILEARYPEYFKIVQIVYLRDKNISEIEGEYVYSFITGAVINLLITWIKSGEVMTPKEMSKFVMKIIEGTFYDLHIPKEEKEVRLDAAYVLKDSHEL